MIPDRCEPAKFLAIGWPCMTGHPTMWSALTLISATHALRTVGIEWCVLPQVATAYLWHVRNMIATKFYRETTFPDLLFMDDDVSCQPQDVIRIARATRPLVGGIYRKKTDEIEWPVGFAKTHVSSDEDGLIEITDDAKEVAHIPTGFLRINRAVFDAIKPVPYVTDDGKEWLGWFDEGIKDRGAGFKMWGEDCDLCWKWQRLGGKIHMIPDIDFGHTGEKTWTGNWAKWMRAQMTAPGVDYQKATAEVCVP